MASFNKFNQFVEDVAKGVHNLSTGTIKVALSNSAPSGSNAVLADITQISNGNGYTTGGTTATVSSCSQTSGTLKLVLADVVFTASGSMGPFRYVVVYNSTPTSPLSPLIGYYDNGSSVTLSSGDTFTVDFDGTNGVLTIA